MVKIISDVALFGVITGVPYLLAWSRLHGNRAKSALYEGARQNAGIRN